MSKKELTRDKNGRFSKKSNAGDGISTEDYIKQLEKERDMYKHLAEIFGSDYLNKRAEVGKAKHDKSDLLSRLEQIEYKVKVLEDNDKVDSRNTDKIFRVASMLASCLPFWSKRKFRKMYSSEFPE